MSPFGLKHKGYNNQITGRDHQYGYNGIEESNELENNMLEMDLRQYDPAIARWVVIDPITHHEFSPYQAFDNNPVFWADPSGADATYNWDSGQYENPQGEAISFDEAMASHGLNADGSESSGDGPGDEIKKKAQAIGAWITGTIRGFLGMSDGSEEEELTEIGYTQEAQQLKEKNDDRKKYIHGQLLKIKEVLSYIPGASMAEGAQEMENGNYAMGTFLTIWGVTEAASGGTTGNAKKGAKIAYKFGGDEAVVHFTKHGGTVMNFLGKTSYNLRNYIDDANWIIENGYYSKKLNGYFYFFGNATKKGSSMFGFVGMKNGGKTISTFHLKSAKQLGL